MSSGELVLTANDRSKPLFSVALTVTLAETSDSITSRGAGCGWTVPISRLRVSSLATGHPGGQRHVDGRAGLVEVARAIDQVGVGQQPGQLGIAQAGRWRSCRRGRRAAPGRYPAWPAGRAAGGSGAGGTGTAVPSGEVQVAVPTAA